MRSAHFSVFPLALFCFAQCASGQFTPWNLSVSPNAQTATGQAVGAAQRFTFTYTHAVAASDFRTVYGLINSGLDGTQACYFSYWQLSNLVYLVHDDGGNATSLSPTVPGGTLPTAANPNVNNQCSLSALSVVSSGTTLTLSMDIAFKSGFSGVSPLSQEIGRKLVYLAAIDNAGLNSGWQISGTWRLQPVDSFGPRVVSMTTSSFRPPGGVDPSRMSYTIIAQGDSPSDLGIVNVLINNGVNGVGGCYLAYTPGVIYLVGDAGDTLIQVQSPSVSNTQCTVHSAGTSSTRVGNTWTISLDVEFNGAWRGGKAVYAALRTVGDSTPSSGWQSMGSWIHEGGNAPVSQVSSMLGGGPTQKLKTRYSSPFPNDIAGGTVVFSQNNTANFNAGCQIAWGPTGFVTLGMSVGLFTQPIVGQFCNIDKSTKIQKGDGWEVEFTVTFTQAFLSSEVNGDFYYYSSGKSGAGEPAPRLIGYIDGTLTNVSGLSALNDGVVSGPRFGYTFDGTNLAYFSAPNVSIGYTVTQFAENYGETGRFFFTTQAPIGTPAGEYQASITLSLPPPEYNGLRPLVSFLIPLTVFESGACVPSVSEVRVNGQATSVFVAGASGSITLYGFCLANVNVNPSAAPGVSITGTSSSDLVLVASYASNANSATGWRNLQVANQYGSAAAQIFGTKLTLKSVSFKDSLLIAKDRLGGWDNGNPVWSRDYAPDVDTWTPGVTTNGRVAYVRGSIMSADVVFDIVPAIPQSIPGGVRIEGAIPGLGSFVGTSAPLLASIAETWPTRVVATTPLPATTKYYNPLSVTWAISQSGVPCAATTCASVGTSANKMYVTLAAPVSEPRVGPTPTYIPLGPPPDTLLLTALHLAVTGAEVSTAPNAFLNTWAKFATPALPADVPANVRTWDGRTLFYYKPGEGFLACATSAWGGVVMPTPGEMTFIIPGLLTTPSGSGQCNSFAELFRYALASNGIASMTTTIKPIDPFSFMAVKNWSTSTPGVYADDLSQFGPYLLKLNAGDLMVPARVDFGDLSNVSGLAGQNTPDPSEKVFSSHYIVKVASGKSGFPQEYFDPSYGQRFYRAGEFQIRSLFGYLKQAIVAPGSPPAPAGEAWFALRKIDSTSPVGITFVP